MKLPDKQRSMEEAIGYIKDGDTIMVGGFGVPGTPMTLIRALVAHGAKDLTLVKNDANEPGMGIDHLLQSGQVKRLITTHLGLNTHAIELMNSGELQIEFNAQAFWQSVYAPVEPVWAACLAILALAQNWLTVSKHANMAAKPI